MKNKKQKTKNEKQKIKNEKWGSRYTIQNQNFFVMEQKFADLSNCKQTISENKYLYLNETI